MQQSTEFLEGQTGKPLSPMKDITSMLKYPKDDSNKTIDYVELNTLRMDQAVLAWVCQTWRLADKIKD